MFDMLFTEVYMEDRSDKNDDTKERLIEAAGDVFAEHGFRSATVRKICSRAGVHIGSVNYHFRNKEGLYAAVLEHSHQSAVRKYPPDLGLRAESTAEEKLRAFIRSFLLRILDIRAPSWHGKLMVRECSDPTSALDQVVQNSIRPLVTYLQTILREILKGSGAAEEDDADMIFLCAMSIVGQCLQYFTGKHVIAALRPKSFDPADIERIADHVMRFSIRGIRGYKS